MTENTDDLESGQSGVLRIGGPWIAECLSTANDFDATLLYGLRALPKPFKDLPDLRDDDL